MEAGLTNIAQLFVAVFEGVITRDDAITDQAETDEVEAIDGLAVDESRQYKQKISKYIRNSLAGVKETIFFVLLMGGNKCREPLLHHYRFLCKKMLDTSMHVVEFVTSHLETIRSEFHDLLSTFVEWSENILEQASDIRTCASLDGDDRTFMTVSLLTILLHNAAAFDRRVFRVFSRLAQDAG